jgi:hypothetical protein
MNSPYNSDAGLGAWLRKYVEDRRVRQVLMVVVALILIGTFALKAFSGAPAALEILAIEVCFIYASLVIITISVAVWPLDQGAESSSSTLRAQRNARGSLFFLIVLGVTVAMFAVNIVVPIWPTLMFETAYQELSQGLISLPEFFRKIPSSDQDGDDIVSDVSDPGSIFENGHIKNPRKLLQLLSHHSEAPIDQLDLRGIRHTAVIAARRVVFDAQSAIELGTTNLLIVTSEIQVKALPGQSAAIFAYRPEDIPPAPTNDTTGKNGSPAGKVTIVVLSKFVDGLPLVIDVRGQHGGEGPKGRQPSPQGQTEDRKDVNGRPLWTFGERSGDQLRARINSIGKIFLCQKIFDDECRKKEIDGNLSDEYISKLEKMKAFLEGCAEKKGRCNLEYCIDTDWDEVGQGQKGQPGLHGERGGKGGGPGDPGRLAIYRLMPNSDSDEQFASHFHWIDGHAVDHAPPSAMPGNGGPGGDGGEGAPAGRGLKADPLGLCRAGNAGQSGQRGPPGGPGPDGDNKKPGEAATVGLLTDLSSF